MNVSFCTICGSITESRFRLWLMSFGRVVQRSRTFKSRWPVTNGNLQMRQLPPPIMSIPSTSDLKSTSSSNKRPHTPDSLDQTDIFLKAPATKVTKLHPFFSKPGSATLSPGSNFQWIKPSLGPKGTCLHGINLAPKSTEKVAAFDLDGTIIGSSRGAGLQWKWWRPSLPSKLEEVYQAGFSVVIISNQAIKKRELDDWKKKIPLMAAALPSVPFRIFAATARDGYRKPLPGMWYELERIYREDGITIDKTASFFVGDAAGRKFDFAATDRKWGANIGIPFFTPEEYFLGTGPAPFTINGTAFDVASLPDLPPWTPTSTPLLPAHSKPEIVLFSGFPCLGKSSFFRRHFQPAGYTHVNQDTLKTRPKCLKAAEEAVLAGKGCVVDNTNRDVQTRKYYVDLAKKLGVPIRCFYFTGSKELAWHNNLYRAYNMPPSAVAREPQRDLIPWVAFTGFEAAHEEPADSEGFDEIKRVNWVFEGNAEERRRWSMWLQIDGK